MSDDLIALGHIFATHALRGELRVRAFNDATETIVPGARVLLRRGATIEERKIASVRRHSKGFLVTFDGCSSIDDAEPLVGSEICIAASALPAAGPDSFYHFELVGMRVVTTAGRELGTVAEVMDTAASDICIVREGVDEYLIPMIKDVIREINRSERRIVIEPIPGLLDG